MSAGIKGDGCRAVDWRNVRQPIANTHVVRRQSLCPPEDVQNISAVCAIEKLNMQQEWL